MSITIKIEDVREVLRAAYNGCSTVSGQGAILCAARALADRAYPRSRADRLAFEAIVIGKVPEVPVHENGDPPFILRRQNTLVLAPTDATIETTPNFMDNPNALLVVKKETYNPDGSFDLICRIHTETGVVRCIVSKTTAGRLTDNFLGEIGNEDEAREYIAHGLPTIDRNRWIQHPKGWGPAQYEIGRLRSIVWESLAIRGQKSEATGPTEGVKS